MAVVEVEELKKGIVGVFINRPERANALNREVWDSLLTIFIELDARDDIRVIILSGRGNKGFSSGLDLMGMPGFMNIINETSPALKVHEGYKLAVDLQRIGRAIESVRHPVISLIYGYCLGGALETIAATDIRLADKSAVFSLPEVELGMVPDLGGQHRLQRIISLGWVKRLAYSGEKIDAETALRIGLVEEVFDDKDTLFKKGLELAERIANNAPLAVRGTKASINQLILPKVDLELETEARHSSPVLTSEDIAEGIQSRMSKKKPEFKGR